ncbi:DsbA family oxidoreductase [Pontibacter fetidus]|uniref:DsbA family oxidoreductase n=1 Tax=Pontibacter fetidus TaxID=2700082 RepID=A0A6B2H5P7_9BACT|nr:DsbA family oxidoreductase [Pontibacter fetidus]NDK55617.1 DsbA family oxidoreductase [Pontibacter fetidus]
MSTQKIKIDIVSDINCPWCYVGEKRMNSAIAATAGKYDFEVNFKPFELNAGIAPEGMDKKEYFKMNYGPQILSQLDEMNRRLANVGKEAGIDFNFDRSETINNTFNGHRLIWLADAYGVQQKVAEALFYSYFTEGNNMNDIALLKEIGIQNGIPAERLENFFESEEGKQEVRQMEQWAQAAGIKGVPAFIINDTYLVSGAQPEEVFHQVFAQVAPALQQVATNGESCDINGNC